MIFSQLLLLGQALVVLLIYFFVWRVMKTARNDLVTAPTQDSTIIPAGEAATARAAAGIRSGRLVVLQSDDLRVGQPFSIGEGLTLGRAPDNDIVLAAEFASAHHAKLRPPNRLVDLESTNGTTVNARPIKGSTRLKNGDRVQIGTTTFRFEGPK